MEERNITEQEGLRIIGSMITSTRTRLEVGDGNLFLNWGLLTVVVSVLVWVGVEVLQTEAVNLLWLLILTGFFFNRKRKRQTGRRGFLSYTDVLIRNIWRAIWCVGGVTVVGCALLYAFTGNVNCWFATMLFAFILVGAGCSFTGAVLKVGSMVWGGAFSAACGMFLIGCRLAGLYIHNWMLMPMFILSFMLMMVIPGLQIRKKAKQR